MREDRSLRVAIVSRNRDRVDFLRLEAVLCQCSVQVCETPPEELSDLDLVLVDLEAGNCIAEGSHCRVVAILTDDEQEKLLIKDQEALRWPVSLDRLHGMLNGRSDSAERKKEDGTLGRNTVYLASNEERRLLYRNQTVYLSDKHWTTLLLLGDRAGEVVTKEELRSVIGGEGNLVEVYVHGLRKQLEAPFGIRLIETVRNRGYRFVGNLKRI